MSGGCGFFLCLHLCSQLLQLTVAALSGWHSPPQLLLSVQTQTDPNQKGREKGWKYGRTVAERLSLVLILGGYIQILNAHPSTDTDQITDQLPWCEPGQASGL